ncbi:MAG: BrnT family toxin [Asticcacaulis sp.]
MTRISFEWDPQKAASNLLKHGVSFEVAERVFSDPLRLTRRDRVVDGEERWQTIGTVNGLTLLLVAHTTWEENDYGEDIEVVRIISAREVTRRERKDYESEAH